MKKVVVLGGGSGLSALLKGIKYVDGIDITAVVTVADSGGSTGVLTQKFDIPAVGDLRRVIASLSRNREELEESMEFRIKGTNTDLDGHTVGNLILASQILMKKDFAKGIEAASKMLNIEGRVLPVSNTFNHLWAELEDGTKVEGEAHIGHSKQPIKKVFYKKGTATKEVIKAIEDADFIILGIGSLYTSLISNLIYKNMQKALKETKAKVIYFANVWTQHGETDNMTLKDHIKAIEDHTHKGFIDKVIVSNTPISKPCVKSYEADHQYLVEDDYKKAIYFDLVEVFGKNNQVKHAEKKIKACVEKLIK